MKRHWPHLVGLDLADPFYWKSRRVDCISGADPFDRIIYEGIRRGQVGSPIYQNTQGGILTKGVCTNAPAREQGTATEKIPS